MDAIQLPTPPPLPPGPVPEVWDPLTEEGAARERHHRLAVLHGACPKCADPPEGPTRWEWLAELAQPSIPEHDDGALDHLWRTPEGEIASFVHGEFRVDEHDAFDAWARSTFHVTGRAYAYVVPVAGRSWTRALFWFDDERLHLETSSFERWFHLELVFEHLWPPVFRGTRILAGLGENLDAPHRPHWPTPPAEASVFTRLVPPSADQTTS